MRILVVSEVIFFDGDLGSDDDDLMKKVIKRRNLVVALIITLAASTLFIHKDATDAGNKRYESLLRSSLLSSLPSSSSSLVISEKSPRGVSISQGQAIIGVG